MTIDEVKALMKAGELARAAKELSGRIKEDPENIELKLLFGTCCRLLGDMDTFVKIDDEISRRPNAASNVRWQKYHALRIAACGAVLLLATGVAPMAEARSAVLYGIAPEYRTLYGVAPLYGLSPDYCKTYSAHIVFDAGGGSGRMSSQTISLGECQDNSYVVPACSFTRSGYRFAGWKLSSTCADLDIGTIAAGETIDLLDWLHVDCRGTLKLTATWQWSGQSEPSDGFEIYAQAKTFSAALYSGPRPIGIITVKTGRIKKNGDVRLSGYVQTISGNKMTFRAASANGASGRISTTLATAKGASASIVISGGTLSGSWDGCRMVVASVGGDIYRSANFDFGDMPEEVDGYPVLYPDESEPVDMNGTRWSCAKAASMKWIKCPPSADCGYGSWKINDSNGRTNISGLKLSYNARQGTFKGIFKMFTWSPGGKKYTVSVSGIVIDGVGYGTATVKKPNLSWSVIVR